MRIEAELLAPAHLVDRQRRERPDQRKTGNEREEQGPAIGSRCPKGDSDTSERIDQPEEHKMRGMLPEVAPAQRQGLAQVAKADAPHGRKGHRSLGAGEYMELRHFSSSFREAGKRSPARR